MTEKRFVIKPSAIVDDVTVIIDSEKHYSFPVLDSTLNHMFCKVMNELADENEQLKQENAELEFKLRTIKAYDRTAKEEHSDTVYDFKKKLETW